jgi:hypothetical protein
MEPTASSMLPLGSIAREPLTGWNTRPNWLKVAMPALPKVVSTEPFVFRRMTLMLKPVQEQQ